jgi:non-canonical (house-cleaning) NTP pyrophosphatase
LVNRHESSWPASPPKGGREKDEIQQSKELNRNIFEMLNKQEEQGAASPPKGPRSEKGGGEGTERRVHTACSAKGCKFEGVNFEAGIEEVRCKICRVSGCIHDL